MGQCFHDGYDALFDVQVIIVNEQVVVVVDEKIIGSSEAMFRVQCPDQDDPYARLMNVKCQS